MGVSGLVINGSLFPSPLQAPLHRPFLLLFAFTSLLFDASVCSLVAPSSFSDSFLVSCFSFLVVRFLLSYFLFQCLSWCHSFFFSLFSFSLFISFLVFSSSSSSFLSFYLVFHLSFLLSCLLPCLMVSCAVLFAFFTSSFSGTRGKGGRLKEETG